MFDCADRYGIAIAEMAGHLKDGKMKSKEDIVVGIETFPETLLKLLIARILGSWFCRRLGSSTVSRRPVLAAQPTFAQCN